MEAAEEARKDDEIASENSLKDAAFRSHLPFDKMASLEVQSFSDLQGPSSLAYIQIRNRILKMWFDNPGKQLTEYAVLKIEAPYNEEQALLLRTYAFLERHGYINYRVNACMNALLNPPSADTLEIKQDPDEIQHHDDELPLGPDGACSLYEDHQIKEEMAIGPTVLQEPTCSYSNTQQNERDLNRIQHHVNELPLDPDGACSLYKDHQIKEEMVIGPTVLHKSTNVYLSSIMIKKKKLYNEEETEKTGQKFWQHSTPNITLKLVSESKLPDISISTGRFGHDDYEEETRTLNDIPDVAEEVIVETQEPQEMKPVASHKIVLPKLPKNYKNKGINIAHLLPQAPFYKIVKMEDVLEKPGKVTTTVKKEEDNENIRLPGGTKLVKVNPLAHLIGNKPVENLIGPANKNNKKRKSVNFEKAVTKALLKLETEEKNNRERIRKRKTLEKPEPNDSNIDTAPIETEGPGLALTETHTQNDITEVAEKVMVETQEPQEMKPVVLHKIVVPKLPENYNKKHIKIAHLLTQAPYYKIVKMEDVLEKPEKVTTTVEKEQANENIRLPGDTKLVIVNPLAHLIGNTPVENLIGPASYYKKRKSVNFEEAVATALLKVETEGKNNRKRYRPFFCDVCQKNFSDKSYLGIHRRIHTGEKPFFCDVCHKSFTQKNGLHQHRRIHMK